MFIYIYIYIVPSKYWNSKDKIALLAVESSHLQIWLKDEYETKLQNVSFYYWVIQHPIGLPTWCEHQYWDSCLTGLSKLSAVSVALIVQVFKARECVVSVISITSVFWIYNWFCIRWWPTPTRMKMRELTLTEKQAIQMLKEKRKSIKAIAKTKGMEKSRVWKQPASPTMTWSAEKTTVVDDRRIKKAVKMNPKSRVCKITNNFQKAAVMLWQSTVLSRLWHRITDVHSKMQTSDQHQT